MSETASLRAVKGMNDILPGASEPHFDSAVWQHLFDVCGAHLGAHGFHQVLLPCVEETALFARGIGQETDIVSKEMYSFTDRGGRALTLRPEGTAGAVRAYIEHNLGKTEPLQRWWYGGPMFRAERPQKGRYRQFYQIGAELFGSASPTADAELLLLLWQLCQRLELTDLRVAVNTVGDRESRDGYRAQLRTFLAAHQGGLCPSCVRRTQTNPLRVLDCKESGCRDIIADAPDILTALTGASRQHFERVCELCAALGVPLQRAPRLVRGLDYYTGTIFEFVTGGLGAQDAVLGGGRYDDLVAEMGGPPTPAIGFAAGVERLALLCRQALDAAGGPALYLIPMTGSEETALRLASGLRERGHRIEVDVGEPRLKRQMRRADRLRARSALVLGEMELASGRGKLKELASAREIDVALDAAAVDEVLRTIQARKPNHG